jgi:hypothetical protein
VAEAEVEAAALGEVEAVGGEEEEEEEAAAVVVGGLEAEALEGEVARAVGGALEGREAAGKVEVSRAVGGAPVGREAAEKVEVARATGGAPVGRAAPGQVVALAYRLRVRVPAWWAATLRARHRKDAPGRDREDRAPEVTLVAAASGWRPVPPLASRLLRSCGTDLVSHFLTE